jgi:hypothetical protein
MGTKAGDDHAVPLCVAHHLECHTHGNELFFWLDKGIDAEHWAINTYLNWKRGKTNEKHTIN